MVRFPAEEVIPRHSFLEIESGYAGAADQYLNGRIPLEKIKAWGEDAHIGLILAPEPDFAYSETTANSNALLVA
jgi:hypothetical protein